jgi:hypothetical protein
MTPETPLTPRQSRAIAAILEAPTRTEAALLAGVAERTLRKWSRLPAFAAELARERSKILDAVATEIIVGALGCARALIATATGAGRRADPARVSAASRVIDLALALDERSSIVQRLETLERLAAERATSPAGRPLPS